MTAARIADDSSRQRASRQGTTRRLQGRNNQPCTVKLRRVLSYPRCRASNRRDGERETRYLPGVTIFLIPRASSKSAHRLKGFECGAALMEGSLDAIERIVDNSNGLSDGRATSHPACYIRLR